MTKTRLNNQAFSIVELSIVLVVIGLIVGGVAAGQSLVKAGEIRSVIRDLQRYQTATHTFYDRYTALPGDMSNATSYWGAQDAGDGLGVDCTAVSSTTTSTCNGSGDNHIGESAGYYYEDFRFWHHLANAQMVEGTYTGVTGGGGTQNCTVGTNCPKSRIAGTGFSVQYYSTAAASFLGAIKGNLLLYGAQTATSFTNGAALLAEDAWGMDTKIDDGFPGFGKLQQYTNATLANCIVDTSNYDLSQTSRACAIIFDLGI
jgi:hypothetical protein